MKKLPDILIVADRGKVLAFRQTDEGHLRAFTPTEIPEGNLKVSEMVTDQAGAFPVSGTPGTGTTEKMSLTAEMEVRSFRQVAERIRGILDRYPDTWWAFAAPSEINGAILDFTGQPYVDRLSLNLKLDLVNMPTPAIERHFIQARNAA